MSEQAQRPSDWKDPLVRKLLFVGGLAVLLLLPIEWIRGLIAERQTRHTAVKAELASTWWPADAARPGAGRALPGALEDEGRRAGDADRLGVRPARAPAHRGHGRARGPRPRHLRADPLPGHAPDERHLRPAGPVGVEDRARGRALGR